MSDANNSEQIANEIVEMIKTNKNGLGTRFAKALGIFLEKMFHGIPASKGLGE